MVSWEQQQAVGYEADGTVIMWGDGSCVSTDTKPVFGIGNGSSLMEMDTSRVFALDKPAGLWREL